MGKKRNKFLAFLCGVLAISSLTACGKTEPVVDEITATIETVSVETTAPVEETVPSATNESIGFWYSENGIWTCTGPESMGSPMSIDYAKYGMPANYAQFFRFIDLIADYHVEDDVAIIEDWHMVNLLTGDDMGKPTEEDLDKAFNLEYGREIVDTKSYPHVIYLSELKEGVVYCYRAEDEAICQYPTIVNDIGQELILYTKHNGMEFTYGEYPFPVQQVPAKGSEFFSFMFVGEDDYRVMYRLSTGEELARLAHNVLTISHLQEIGGTYNLEVTYETDQKTDLSFFEYIHNDTDEVIKIKVTEVYPSYEDEAPKEYNFTIEPGELIQCLSINHIVSIV